MIKIGIVGAAGYTGGELLRILVNHPQADIAWAHSKSQAGKPVYATHTDLLGDTDLTFSGDDFSTLLNMEGLGVIFLCSGHNESKRFLTENTVPESVKIIDLSTDFRNQSDGFVYGLPELQRERICTANKIANPGCFATSIQLALLPLAATALLMSLGILQAHFAYPIHFIPYRGDFTRGIMANVYTKFGGSLAEAIALYQNYYASHPFTHISTQEIDLKQVVNTNKCLLQLQKHGDNLLITSIIDNLTKGASGQAVQNMNLLFNLPEDTGLRLKSAAF